MHKASAIRHAIETMHLDYKNNARRTQNAIQ